MDIQRVWAMPSADTFDIPPIGELVKWYLRRAKISIDPFARNKRWATYTNDLNPATAAEYHLDALDFLNILKERGITADLVLFDPPYSPRQIKECYESIGLRMNGKEAWRTQSWAKERNIINELLVIGGIVISCGWNSCGMGRGRSYRPEKLLVVCHGAGHNDTLVLVERKQKHQAKLFQE